MKNLKNKHMKVLLERYFGPYLIAVTKAMVKRDKPFTEFAEKMKRRKNAKETQGN